jgi:hypothetical protein
MAVTTVVVALRIVLVVCLVLCQSSLLGLNDDTDDVVDDDTKHNVGIRIPHPNSD